MAVKKYYSNKSKPGWRENPDHKPLGKGADPKKQKPQERKYFSWGYDYHRKHDRPRESGFATKDLAAAALARIVLSEKSSKYELDLEAKRPLPTVAELRQKRMDACPERREKNMSGQVLVRISEIISKRTGTRVPRIDQITPSVIEEYKIRRRADGLADTSINRELQSLHAALEQVEIFWDKEDLPEWKVIKVARIKTPRTRRERVLSSREGRAILYYLLKPRTSDESVKIFHSRRRAGLLFLLSAITGARPGELVRLKQSDIMTDIGKLRIIGRKTRYTKSNVVRYFPLVDVVQRVLFEALEIAAGDFIFSQKGTITNTYYDQVKAACESAGIAYGNRTDGGLIPYDLRHTATTLLAQSGADIETISSITGQSHDSIWHYLHASQDSIGRATSVLENFGTLLIGDGLGLDTNEKAKSQTV